MPYDPISSPLTGRQSVTTYDMVKDAGPHNGVTTQSTNNGRVVRTFDKRKKVAKWRVAGFHVLNFITAGFAGAVGGLCARSQAMGSQKNVNSTRHFGQLYNAATHKTKREGGWSKTLKTLANIWSFPAHVILSPARLLQNSLGPDMFRFRSLRSKEFGKSSWNVFSSVRGVSTSAAKNRKEIHADLHQELKTAKNFSAQHKKQFQISRNNGQRPQSDYTQGPVRVACSSGSPSMKKAMLLHSKKEYNSENVMFLNWSSNVLDKADPDSPNHDPNYRISKREMLDAYQNFVKIGSKYEINVDFATRDLARRTLDPAQSGTRLHTYNNRLKAAKAEADRKNLWGQQGGVAFDPHELEDVAVLGEDLETVEQETFNNNDHNTLVAQLKEWDHHIADIQADSVNRLRDNFQDAAGIQDD